MGRVSILSQRENQCVLWTQITQGGVKQGLDLERRLEKSARSDCKENCARRRHLGFRPGVNLLKFC